MPDPTDVSAIHTALDEALAAVRSLFEGKVPEKIAQFEHFITGAHGSLDQVADSASKE